MLSYEDAQAAAFSASAEPFVHPAYSGGTSDLGYLREWVLNQVVAIYGGSASDFDQATIYSTTILRDFVHRALYQIDSSVPTHEDLGSAFLGWEVASGFRYPVQGACGLLAWQLWEVFRAFGFETRKVDSIDGDIDAYGGSHVSSEVYIPSLSKWVVQDATYNFLYLDNEGNFLSWYEAREAVYEGFTLSFVGFHDYRSYQFSGAYSEHITLAEQSFFKTYLLKSPWSWFDSDGIQAQATTLLFPDYLTAHQVDSNQGATFADAGAAASALATSDDWLVLSQDLRAQGYYVSGFALVTGAGTSHWLTVRLGDGTYISANLEIDVVLNGSYDQLVNDATGGPGSTHREILNPGVDLAAFLSPAYLLAWNGEVMDGGVPQIRNQVEGTAAADALPGSSGGDVLYGLEGDDLLAGEGGNDVLVGGAGSDVLIGGSGQDYLLGGDGADLASYETATSGLSARLYNSSLNTGDAAGDGYSSIEGLRGTAYTDTLCGDANSNLLEGGDGNDSLSGYGGGDSFSGGDGNDYMVGAAGADSFDGGAGTDTVSYEAALSGLTASLDNPGLNTGEAAGDVYSGVEGLGGTDYDDLLLGDGGDNLLIGGQGSDVLVGGEGADLASYETATSGLTARLDNPLLNTGDAAGDSYSSIEGLRGTAYADTLYGDANSNQLEGGDGNDSLSGYGGGDTFSGGDGNDYMVGASGADSFDGGTGTDTVSYEAALSGLTASLDNPGLNTGEAAGDVYIGVERLLGTDYGDLLLGDGGDNVLNGGKGSDVLVGGGGNDLASYETATSGLMARLDNPLINTGEAAGDSYSSIEGLRGTGYGDTLCGNATSNLLEGGAGNDSLWGYGGGDIFSGGDGNDYMVGAAGADSFDGGTGIDTVSYYFASSAVTVYLSGGGTQGEAAGDTYLGVESVLGSAYDDTLCGTSGTDVLSGHRGNDSLWGYGGSDVFYGGDGNDYMTGAAGADYFDGGIGVDTVSYYFASSAVTVYLAGGGIQGEADGDLYANVESVLGSAYDDTLCGTAGANTLMGDRGNDSLWGYGGGDTLIGGDGNDVLSGGAGHDLMLGGMGSDVFMWQLADAGTAGAPLIDTLVDFELADGDTVNLDDLLQGETTSTLDSFLFFEKVALDTVLHVSSAGALSPDDSIAALHDKEDLQVIFQGIDLFSLGDNHAIIHDLFAPLLAA
jgi:Ca2+-binding RTX toxin-like protein